MQQSLRRIRKANNDYKLLLSVRRKQRSFRRTDFRVISYLGFSLKFVKKFPLWLKSNKNNTDYMKTYVHLWDCFFPMKTVFWGANRSQKKQETNWTSRRLWDNYRKPDISTFTRAVPETTFMILCNSSNGNGSKVAPEVFHPVDSDELLHISIDFVYIKTVHKTRVKFRIINIIIIVAVVVIIKIIIIIIIIFIFITA